MKLGRYTEPIAALGAGLAAWGIQSATGASESARFIEYGLLGYAGARTAMIAAEQAAGRPLSFREKTVAALFGAAAISGLNEGWEAYGTALTTQVDALPEFARNVTDYAGRGSVTDTLVTTTLATPLALGRDYLGNHSSREQKNNK